MRLNQFIFVNIVNESKPVWPIYVFKDYVVYFLQPMSKVRFLSDCKHEIIFSLVTPS